VTIALVAVDLMDRIVDLDLAPLSGPAVVAGCLGLAGAVHAAGGEVISIRTERPGEPEQPPGSGLVPCIREASTVELVKRSMGAFATSELREVLAARHVSSVVIAGIATNLGVESTARGAVDLGYDVILVPDAMSALSADEHDASVRLDFPRLGSVRSTATVRATLRVSG
jgi:nicotinamidase-related amidase